jgi:hypothetical protein
LKDNYLDSDMFRLITRIQRLEEERAVEIAELVADVEKAQLRADIREAEYRNGVRASVSTILDALAKAVTPNDQ